MKLWKILISGCVGVFLSFIVVQLGIVSEGSQGVLLSSMIGIVGFLVTIMTLTITDIMNISKENNFLKEKIEKINMSENGTKNETIINELKGKIKELKARSEMDKENIEYLKSELNSMVYNSRGKVDLR